MAEILADDIFIDDRRRVVNAGVRQGRDADDGKHAGDRRPLGSRHITSTVIATRGERLALTRDVYLGPTISGPRRFTPRCSASLRSTPTNRIVAARRIRPRRHRRCHRGTRRPLPRRRSGRPTHTLGRSSCKAYAAFNRHELPADDGGLGRHRPPRCAHVRLGDLTAYFRACGISPRQHQDVHRGRASAERPRSRRHPCRLTGTSREGFDAEWRGILRLHGRRRLGSTAARYSTRQISTPRSRGSTNSTGRPP